MLPAYGGGFSISRCTKVNGWELGGLFAIGSLSCA